MQPPWQPSASLIWPANHSWSIATDIDWDSTLVAGEAALAEGLLTDDRLEAYEVTYADDLSWAGDRMNPKPAWLLEMLPHD